MKMKERRTKERKSPSHIYDIGGKILGGRLIRKEKKRKEKKKNISAYF